MEKQRKARIVNTKSKDILIIENNIQETCYDEETKKRLKLQSKRMNEEMENLQISLTAIQKETGIAIGTLSNYANGKRLIKEDLLQPICKALKVSKNYLRGTSDVKKYENEEISNLFGLNDNSINNLSASFNKEYINCLFDDDIDKINYFFEKLKEYRETLEKYRNENKKSEINGLWEKDNLTLAKYKLDEAFHFLIDK